MDNTTTAGRGGGGGVGGESDDGLVNWVALVVSLVALLGTLLQVLQQYAQSAYGYSNCGESVMGEWHNSKRRRLLLTELRFQVLFDAPVIFVSPPSNRDKKPVNGPLHYVDGTDESLRNTRTLLSSEEQKRNSPRESDQVHTADNEKASWVSLLSQLQTMEKQSQDWQHDVLQGERPSRFRFETSFKAHTLAIAVQSKRRSWDTMPAGVKKPYATTTMCHLIEIAAMLGIHWKQFDRSGDRYRAEGNGQLVTGSQVADLGLMFTFQICGESRFQENRVIPVDEVKEMCFGFVPTLFSEKSDKRRLHLSAEESRNGSLIQLGSMAEIAESMALIGCNTNTSHIFLSAGTRHTHLFPVPFELVGMLGKTLHIKETVFRMLPNPTPYHWDRKFFSLRRLMRAYRIRLHGAAWSLPASEQMATLRNLTEGVADAIKAQKRDDSFELLDTLHHTLDQCDNFLKRMAEEGEGRRLFLIVLREHLQEVLRMLNQPIDQNAKGDHATPRSCESRAGTPNPTTDGATRGFGKLRALGREEKQDEFMHMYFSDILTHVREAAVSAMLARHQTSYPADDASVHEQEMTLGSKADEAPDCSPSSPLSPSATIVPTILVGEEGVMPAAHLAAPSTAGLQQQQQQHQHQHQHLRYTDPEALAMRSTEIWCTLVFRMLCWLMLHDFHEKDVQVSKSELRGSRLPVYIA